MPRSGSCCWDNFPGSNLECRCTAGKPPPFPWDLPGLLSTFSSAPWDIGKGYPNPFSILPRLQSLWITGSSPWMWEQDGSDGSGSRICSRCFPSRCFPFAFQEWIKPQIRPRGDASSHFRLWKTIPARECSWKSGMGREGSRPPPGGNPAHSPHGIPQSASQRDPEPGARGEEFHPWKFWAGVEFLVLSCRPWNTSQTPRATVFPESSWRGRIGPHFPILGRVSMSAKKLCFDPTIAEAPGMENKWKQAGNV